MEGIKRFRTVSEEAAAHQHSQCTFFLTSHALASPHTAGHAHHTPSDTLAYKPTHTKTQQIPIHEIKIDI